MDLKGAVLRNFYSVGTLVNEATPERFFSLKVPHYQRPYKWDAARVKSLIEDWKDNSDSHHEKSKGYFAGAIVTVAGAELSEHSLIDGQQRVTTLFLTNYINFIIIRQLILIDIRERRCGKLESLSEKLFKSARFVFRDEAIINHFKSTSKFIKEYSDDDKMERFHNEKDDFEDENVNGLEKNPIDEFYERLWVVKPEIKEDSLEIKDATIQILSDYIKPDALNLHYDRNSYNSSLVKVLSRFYIDTNAGVRVTAEVVDSEWLSESEQVYATALITILEKFEQICLELEKDNLRIFLFEMHKLITEFLEQVTLCVIQTGAVDDAYTLFEVMNDRALALDDLDLIKNQFFKEFVQKNVNQEEQLIDQKIQSLDKQWGDSIFNHRAIRAQDKKLIPYLSTVFLTGDDSITNTKNEKYRLYLKNYLDKNDQYDGQTIQRDFNIFQVCYELINIVGLRYQKREEESLTVEFNLESTDFQKTIYFLNALKQDGVTSGLVNFVLITISQLSPEFDIRFSTEFIKLLVLNGSKFEAELAQSFSTARNPVVTRDKVKIAIDNIHKQSRIMWNFSMMASNAELPRNLAKEVIKEFNISSNGSIEPIEVKKSEHDALQSDFYNWLSNWNYDKDSRFKIKTLFARLLKFSLEDDKLIQKPTITTINSNLIAGLELDHLVPQNPREPSMLSVTEQDRELYIHSLANMMPLPKKQNIQKSNYPLEDSIKFYEDSGLDKHFLIDQIKELLEEARADSGSPSKFFSTRKKELIKYFQQIVEF